MIGLIFATRMEAEPFLGLIRAELLESKPFAVYRSPSRPQLHIVISRMGKVAAATACQAMILSHGADRIINAGACGLLNDHCGLDTGDLVGIASAVEGDHEVLGRRPLPIACATRPAPDLPPARLVTCDRPVFDARRRAACGRLGDVVDMEGAAIARVADLYDVPCEMIKGISDNAAPIDRQTLLDNVNRVSESIATLLHRHLIA